MHPPPPSPMESGTRRPRVLYLDAPFATGHGGDRHRSRFLWHLLQEAFDTEWLPLLPADGTVPAGEPDAAAPPLRRCRPPRWDSESLMTFDRGALENFAALLSARRYDIVVARFHAPWRLVEAATRHPSRPAPVVDLDMVSSRLAALSWGRKRSWRNRWFLIEHWKLRWLERRILRRPGLVFLSNPAERDALRSQGVPCEPPCRLEVLPNPLPDTGAAPKAARRPVVLFFGSLDSSANQDAFRFLMEEVLPRLEPHLRQTGTVIEVAGRNPPPWFSDRITRSGSDRVRLVGAVESITRSLAECRLVLLPLRVASGTRTRILEAAAAGRAVVTTPMGAEGLEVGGDARIAAGADALAGAVAELLRNPEAADLLGGRLRARCAAHYGTARVAADAVAAIRRHLDGWKGGTP